MNNRLCYQPVFAMACILCSSCGCGNYPQHATQADKSLSEGVVGIHEALTEYSDRFPSMKQFLLKVDAPRNLFYEFDEKCWNISFELDTLSFGVSVHDDGRKELYGSF